MGKTGKTEVLEVVNGLHQSKMVYNGNCITFTPNVEYNKEFHACRIVNSKNCQSYEWQYPTNSKYKIITHKEFIDGIKTTELPNNDIYIDGKLIQSHVNFQFIKNLLVKDGYAYSKLHKEYMRGAGRLKEIKSNATGATI